MKLVALDAISEIVRGITFSKADGSSTPEKGLLPVIRAGSIQNELLIDEGQIWVPKEKIKENQIIKKNDIIMCMSSGSSSLVGKCAKASEDWIGSFGAFCSGIRPDITKCVPSYLYYFLCSPTFRNWSGASDGANIKNIRVSELAEFQIPLPPLETQKQIAGVLEKADQLRKDCEQMEQELNSLAQSVFIEMFGDLRVKGRYTKKVFFSEIFNISSKLVDPKLEQYEDMPHIGPEHIEKITGKILPYKTAKEDGLISGKFHFKQGCVLFSKIRPNLKKVAIPNFDGLCSADMYPLEPVDGISTKEFIWGLILSLTFDEYLQVLASRANIPKINRKELSLFEFYLPSFSDQKQYSSQLIQIQQQIDINRELMKEVSNNFNALMQKAFSGELNLANVKT
ncbi:restriction endonuclease subunit S [Shewanella sp. SP1S2-4]|uniref:restriction endonuclease subunit S n=1 Tax=Shewanella sp. SP1S2-4 TaxID=3063537 RepID=UPI002891CF5A|nr:restriction endonuclease subunit S [Shewanella sp. SP1S2-4]MDT3319583.1 restriction endonuclease subunit S [Shewanella sp. SP1S2-4]